MILLKIAQKSLLNRKSTTLLTILSIALSLSLLLGIERIRTSARASFESTVSGVDLIVGARSGPVNLLLYSVFRIGNATNNISYESFNEFSVHGNVQWTIPISLGDSHRGYRVIGTNQNYFLHYQYSGKNKLKFKEGKPFKKTFDLVLGSEIAKKLNYKLGDKVSLSHGTGDINFQNHNDKPFNIVGILKRTGTPVDRSLHVSLEAIEAIHVDWMKPAGGDSTLDSNKTISLKPKSITAFFVKLKSKIAIFNTQREINDYTDEALLAILPGVTLRNLWQSIGFAEKTLFIVSILVFIVSLIGVMISLLSTLNERRREMAILRSIGAKRSFVFSVLIIETCVLTISGIMFGVVILYSGLIVFRPILEDKMGLSLGLLTPSPYDLVYIGLIFGGALLISIIPGWKAYKNSLADGLIVKN